MRLAADTRPRVAGRGPEVLAGALLAIWWLVPFAVLFPDHDGTFTGSIGLQADDHMQYLAFIRDAGENVLISNRFDVVADPHLFLHPLFALSGLIWKLGASLQVALIAWQPVAAVALVAAFAAYVRRFFADAPGARLVALLLALFFFTPAAALAEWLSDDGLMQFGTLVVGLELFPASYPWGGAPGALSIAAMPFFLLAIERLMDPARRAPGRSALYYGAWAGLAGALAAWLHPWQGIILLAITAALVASERFDRRCLALALPAALTAAPLAYFWVLSKTDSSWAIVSQPNDFPHWGTWLAAGLAPAALALPGFLPLRGLDVGERLVRLWPLAALAVYLGLQESWFYHALAGLSLPLGVLGVRFWRRFEPPRAVVALIVAALTLPGMAFMVLELAESREDHFIAGDERRALAYLDSAPREGAVLAPQRLGIMVPGFADRNTYAGHYNWTPDYEARTARAEALFDGELSPRGARRLVRESGVGFLLADCGERADLRPQLGPLVARTQRFGCATVYELRSLQAQSRPASAPRSGSPT
ncbi:MAG: hypothetical protein ACR2G3_12960 [Solirubrobacterales bacterium]